MENNQIHLYSLTPPLWLSAEGIKLINMKTTLRESIETLIIGYKGLVAEYLRCEKDCADNENYSDASVYKSKRHLLENIIADLQSKISL